MSKYQLHKNAYGIKYKSARAQVNPLWNALRMSTIIYCFMLHNLPISTKYYNFINFLLSLLLNYTKLIYKNPP